jgi:hypothetical protein
LASSSSSSGRTTVVLVTIILGLLVALFLWWRSSSSPGFTVSVEARDRVGPSARVNLEATVSPPSAGTRGTFTWSATEGQVKGDGPKAVWVAPARGSAATISVTVTVDGVKKSAAKTIEIADYRLPVADAPPSVTLGSDKYPEGYKLVKVTLDRSEACTNDDIRVTTVGEDPNGESRFLTARVTLGDQIRFGTDSVIPVGPRFGSDLMAFPHQVTVELMDTRYASSVVATKVLPVTLKPCRTTGKGLWVTCGASSHGAETAECSVGTSSQEWKLPFTPVRYEWTVLTDKGGKYPLVSQIRTVRFPYPTPYPDAAIIHHVVAVRVVGPNREIVEGRGSLSVPNNAFSARVGQGLLLLSTQFTSPLVKDGHNVLDVTLFNPNDEAIAVDSLVVSTAGCSRKPGDPPRDLRAPPPANPPPSPPLVAGQPQPATSQLPSATLAPGQRVKFSWKMPVDEARCLARTDLTGKGTVSGLPAMATWLMPTGPDWEAPVDPLDKERHRLAVEILMKRRGLHDTSPLVITDADLADLETAGLIPPRPTQAP